MIIRSTRGEAGKLGTRRACRKTRVSPPVNWNIFIADRTLYAIYGNDAFANEHRERYTNIKLNEQRANLLKGYKSWNACFGSSP